MVFVKLDNIKKIKIILAADGLFHYKVLLAKTSSEIIDFWDISLLRNFNVTLNFVEGPVLSCQRHYFYFLLMRIFSTLLVNSIFPLII
jgi:hypothetical protein